MGTTVEEVEKVAVGILATLDELLDWPDRETWKRVSARRRQRLLELWSGLISNELVDSATSPEGAATRFVKLLGHCEGFQWFRLFPHAQADLIERVRKIIAEAIA